MAQTHYPLHVLHEYRIGRRPWADLARVVSRLGKRSLTSLEGISKRRIDVLPYGALIMERLLRAAKPDQKLDVVGFTADQFRTGLTATDAEAQALYTKDPSRYKFGERRKIRYLTVDTQALRASITPTPQQVEAHYQANLQQFSNPEQVHAQHVLLKTTGKDAAAVRKQAESILKEAKAPGADFPALARKYSEDEASKGSGGDLGFFGRGSMVKPFEDAAFSLAPGQTSDLVQTDFGFHVIKVLEKRAAGQRALAEVKDQITEQLKWQQAQERATALSAALGARIKSPADLEAAGKRERPQGQRLAVLPAHRCRCPSSDRPRRSPARPSSCRTARSAAASAPGTRRCSSHWRARKRRACRSSTK